VSWRGGRITTSTRSPSTTLVLIAVALPKLTVTRWPLVLSTIAGN
jgi:hypothetical protein